MKRLTGRAPDGTAYLYNMGGTNAVPRWLQTASTSVYLYNMGGTNTVPRWLQTASTSVYLYNMGGTNTAIDKLAAYEDTGMEPEEISTRRWIPVTERLPEPLVNVLALYGDGRMDIDWVDHEGCFVYENLYDGVTHWMPLPEPPEEVTP